MLSYTLMLLNNGTISTNNASFIHYCNHSAIVIECVCVWAYIGVYPAAHAQTRSPPSARRPLPDTRESDPELGEEPQLHGTARTSLDPGRTGERDATVGLELCSGTVLFHRQEGRVLLH